MINLTFITTELSNSPESQALVTRQLELLKFFAKYAPK